MALHATSQPETIAKLKRQKRNSTISSIIIALLFSVLVCVILWIISLSPIFKNNLETVSYATSNDDDQEVTKPEMTNQVERKPSAPSSSMAKVIAANTPSPVAVPVPDITVTEPSLDFGDGDDFGDGWGSGSGSGSGGGGSASFFKQKIKAERVCYVIDYSASMGGKKIKMLKKELVKSISKLPDGIEYQLIFFAGPAWIAGDKVNMIDKNKEAIVKSGGKEYDWRNRGGNDWERRGKKQPVEWIKASKESREKSIKAIKETQLVWGTTWNDPIEMALEMKPLPDYVFFMTDGAPGTGLDGALKTAKKMGSRAKTKRVKVNTIALLLPKAKEALEYLAEKSGGEFTLIDK